MLANADEQTGSCKLRLNSGETVLYSGTDNALEKGVAIGVSRKREKFLIEWEPVSLEL